MIRDFEGFIYRENFKKSTFRKNIETLFAVEIKFKDEQNTFVQKLFQKIMNSLHGVQIRKVNNDFYKCNSQHWMETEYDGNVLAYWRLPNEITQ